MHVPRPYADRGYAFASGPQHLDGDAALAYVRDAEDTAKATTVLRMQTTVRALSDRLSVQAVLSDLGRLSDVLGQLTKALSGEETLPEADLVRLGWDERGVGPSIWAIDA